MKIYNNNMAFGDGGPFDFDGDDFDAACEAFADEMARQIYEWACEKVADDMDADAATVCGGESEVGTLVNRDAEILRVSAELRAAFIAGLSEVK